jgi:dienelactone hydrolase
MFGTILLAAMTAAARGPTATTVPFTLYDNRMLIAVSVDGKGPFMMIVDTGDPTVTLTPEVAHQLKLAPRAGGSVTGAGSGSESVGLARLKSVQIGALRFNDLDGEVLDLSAIRAAFGFPHLDGIVGYSILRRLRVGVDMDGQKLTFSYPALPAPKTAATLAFTTGGSGIPQIPAAVDGVHGTFIIDTGDRSSLTLFRRFAQTNDFYRNAPVRNAITGVGIGGPIYSDVLRTTVSLFGTTISGVVTRASRDRGGAFVLAPQDASIGTGLLKRFNIIYDYPDRQISAWPSTFFSQPDTYRPLAYVNGSLHVAPPANDPTVVASPLPRLPRHGIFGVAVAASSGGVAAQYVIPESAAAQAGLRAGDTIRAIGGVPVATVAQFLTAVHDLHANDRVSVNVIRDGAPLRLDAVLGGRDERDAGLVTEYNEIVVDDSIRRTLLTMPRGLSSQAPAVLLIGGIGCYSVDVAANAQDAYMRLTHDIARAGFVTMRVEKSGVGDSQGPPCHNVDFEAEVRGYAAALAVLQRNPHVDPARIYLLGHSIGTVIAPILATADRVAGVIALEGVGRDWPEYEIRNLRRDLELDDEAPAAVDQALIEKAECMQRLFFEFQGEAQIERAMPVCREHNSIYPTAAAYVQQVAHLNVIAPWPKLGIPVLAIYGTSDFETELADHQRIVDVVNAAHPKSATLEVIPSMSHGLGRAASPKAAENDDVHGSIEPYDTDVSSAIVAWLRSESHV